MARLTASWVREVDAEAAAEVVVPALLRGQPGTDAAMEAKLDLHVWATAPVPLDAYLDFTCRH
eukprot:706420-Heterocapsa_arctica.AAC.1